MVHALYERGVAPDVIVGTSVGALNGAFLASRPATPDTARQLAEVWRGVSRWNVFPRRIVAPVGNVVDIAGDRRGDCPGWSCVIFRSAIRESRSLGNARR